MSSLDRGDSKASLSRLLRSSAGSGHTTSRSIRRAYRAPIRRDDLRRSARSTRRPADGKIPRILVEIDALKDAPLALTIIAAGGLILGGLPLAWITGRFLRFVGRRPQPRVSFSRYMMTIATSSLLLGIGIGASGLAIA